VSQGKFAYVNDKIVALHDAFLHVSDLAIQRGYGVFDFLKIKNGHPFFIEHHLDRFFQSAKIMKLTIAHSREVLKKTVHALIEQNEMPESGIKMILTGGYSVDGYQPATSNLIVSQHSLTLPSLEQVEKGIHIITHPYAKEFPEAKTINYTMGIWLLDHLRANAAADVLYYENEIVSEFPRCNVFAVDNNGTVITPAKNILKGVTRTNVLTLAARRYTVMESDITRSDLYAAKEVFLTSTTKRILPIVSIDKKLIGDGKPGPVAKRLLEDLISLEIDDLVS